MRSASASVDPSRCDLGETTLRALPTTTISAVLVALLCSSCAGGPGHDEEEPFVAFVVRHAEPLYPAPPDAPEDPRLNVMGQDRADALARALAPERITAVYATERRRAQETAQPTARQSGLRVRTYDSNDLEAVTQVTTRPGARTLLVGHSDTVSRLVTTLGALPGEEMDADSEFDRLTLVVGTSRRVQRIDLRYGLPLPEDWRTLASTRRP